MPYNWDLARRVHTLVENKPGVIEKKMFGGVGFLLHGNMACGVLGEDLIVRIGSEKNALALAQPHVRPFMPQEGRPMAGWVLVSLEGLKREEELQFWVEQGFELVKTLPAKK